MFLIVLTTNGLPQQFWDGHNWYDLWSRAKLYNRREEADTERERIIKMFGNEIIARIEVRVIAGIEPAPLAQRVDFAIHTARLLNALRLGTQTLQAIEFGAEIEGKKHCPLCFTPQPNHAPDCSLARALAKSREALARLDDELTKP